MTAVTLFSVCMRVPSYVWVCRLTTVAVISCSHACLLITWWFTDCCSLACCVFTFMFEYLNQLPIALLLTVPSCVVRLPSELHPESPVVRTFKHIITLYIHSFVCLFLPNTYIITVRVWLSILIFASLGCDHFTPRRWRQELIRRWVTQTPLWKRRKNLTSYHPARSGWWVLWRSAWRR